MGLKIQIYTTRDGTDYEYFTPGTEVIYTDSSNATIAWETKYAGGYYRWDRTDERTITSVDHIVIKGHWGRVKSGLDDIWYYAAGQWHKLQHLDANNNLTNTAIYTVSGEWEEDNETSDSDSSYKLTSEDKDAFANFEPYIYGEPAFPDDYLGSDTEKVGPFQEYPFDGGEKTKSIGVAIATADIKINQKEINVGYSYEGSAIKGCEKGTVVLANHPNSEFNAVLASGSMNPYDHISEKVKIIINKQDKTIDVYEINYQSSTLQCHLNESNFTDYGLVFPKRLGILLVGGGGGAGGFTAYDPNKNGQKGDQMFLAGGSGGGGGTLWGVIDSTEAELTNGYLSIESSFNDDYIIKVYEDIYSDVKKCKTVAEKKEKILKKFPVYSNSWAALCKDQEAAIITYYKDKRTLPSHPGKNGAKGTGVTHNAPHYGTNGNAGPSLALKYCIDSDGTTKATEWARATGGGGGARGEGEIESNGGSSGDGIVYNSSKFMSASKVLGTKGISTSRSMESAIMPEKSFKIDFFPDRTNNNTLSEIVYWESVEGIVATTDAARIPGGHSYGSGGRPSIGPGYGGGGCTGAAQENGGKCYWAIYY